MAQPHLRRSVAAARSAVRRILTVAVVVALCTTVPAATAQAVSLSFYSLTANVHLIGTAKPYRIQIRLAPSEYPVNLAIDLVRHGTTGNQVEEQHSYEVNGAQMSCAASLSHCVATDAGNMGNFGQLNMSFRHTALATHRDDLCPDNSVRGHETFRKGSLSGTLRLRTGTGYFGTIRNGGQGVHTSASIAATIESYTPSGHNCTYQTGCVASYYMQHLDFISGEFAVASWPASKPGALLQVGYQDPSSTTTVAVKHQLIATVPKRAFRITSNSPYRLQQALVDYGSLAPFANGVATFVGTDLPQFSDPCHQVNRNGTFGGVVSLRFDGWGTYHLAGGDASMIWDAAS